jgi:hypothetical protein
MERLQNLQNVSQLHALRVKLLIPGPLAIYVMQSNLTTPCHAVNVYGFTHPLKAGAIELLFIWRQINGLKERFLIGLAVQRAS